MSTKYLSRPFLHFLLVVEQYCPPLADTIDNGVCVITGLKLDDIATYTCNDGAIFENVGLGLETQTRTCRAGSADLGIWDPDEPKCIGAKCSCHNALFEQFCLQNAILYSHSMESLSQNHIRTDWTDPIRYLKLTTSHSAISAWNSSPNQYTTLSRKRGQIAKFVVLEVAQMVEWV